MKCCQISPAKARPPPRGAAAPAGSSEEGEQPPGTPSLDMQMLRSKSELRILQPAPAPAGAPPAGAPAARSLFEASFVRVASHEARAAAAGGVAGSEPPADADDGGLPRRFLDAYIEALASGAPGWATAPAFAALFDERATFTGQDKASTAGKAAVLRRLEKGVETLRQMAGADAAPPEWGVAGPARTERGTHELRCTIRRGVVKLSFVLDFRIVGGRIARLTNTRV
jgi:hypothetical protein